MHMFPRLPACLACLLVVLTTGCRTSARYVGQRTEVEVTYQAGPSTTVYSMRGTAGHYSFDRYEGTTELTIAGAGRWGLSERIAGESSQLVAQPLVTQAVHLKAAGDGAELVFENGVTCQLGFVRGSWNEYQAGRKVVFKLDDASWNTWTAATNDAFLELVESLGGRIQSIIEQKVSLSYIEDPDILVHEKPLIQADRQQLMIFFEKLRVSNRFAVVEWYRNEAWWVLGSRLSPDAKRFLLETGEFAARLVIHLSFSWLEAVSRGEIPCR